jgi:hypothetical protein
MTFQFLQAKNKHQERVACDKVEAVLEYVEEHPRVTPHAKLRLDGILNDFRSTTRAVCGRQELIPDQTTIRLILALSPRDRGL